MRSVAMYLAAASLAVSASCYAGNASPYGDRTDSGVQPGDGIPCEAASLLVRYCVRCHNGGSLSASDVPLTSYDELTARSGNTTVGESALAKLRDTRKPMPPRGEPAPDAQEVQAFADWVHAGYPRASCDALDAGMVPDPYDTPTTCTSGAHWTSGNEESPNIRPGGKCISCHRSEGEGPRFDFAGTLYASAHEPNDCNGGALDTRVIIVDADGQELVLTPNRVGNFSARNTNLALPYTVRLERGDQIREMVTPQENGDCNGCHTESGKDKAPGRVMAPAP